MNITTKKIALPSRPIRQWHACTAHTLLFIAADGGIDRSRIMVRASDGKWRKSSEVEDVAIPYKPIEIRVKK